MDASGLDARRRVHIIDNLDPGSVQIVYVEQHRQEAAALSFRGGKRPGRRPGVEVGKLGDPPATIVAIADDVAVPSRSPRMFWQANLADLPRFIATPTTSKHWVFVWLPAKSLPSIATVAIASSDDAMFGVLQSSVHEVWSRAVSTQLREAVSATRYPPQSSFETFPFPHPTPEQRERVREAARRLVELRDGWLNPPGLDPADLAKRTLTNLYNQRPTWLANAHGDLDAAVFAAYGWPADLSDSEILERLLALNLGRAALTKVQAAASLR